jgi:carboxylesterase
MTQHAHLDPGPFLLEGGPTGVLMIHGFTGAPPELRLLGDDLNARGLTVLAPLLPGHGTRVEDMNRVHWEGWTDHVEAAWSWLAQRCERVFVGGLSMGGLLALHMAALEPRIEGLLLYAPALRVNNRLLPWAGLAKRVVASRPKGPRNLVDPAADGRIWSYDRDPIGAAEQLYRGQRLVRAVLPSIVCPTLVFHSTLDTTVPMASAQDVLAGLGTDDKQLITLTGSGHCLTADAEWERVAEQSWAFIQRVAGLEG